MAASQYAITKRSDQNSQVLNKGCHPKKAIVKSKVVAKKWL